MLWTMTIGKVTEPRGTFPREKNANPWGRLSTWRESQRCSDLAGLPGKGWRQLSRFWAGSLTGWRDGNAAKMSEKTETAKYKHSPSLCSCHLLLSYCEMPRDEDGAEAERTDIQWLPQLETHPIWESQRLTLLMILCYACRQEPSITVCWETSSSSGWRQMQRRTAKCQVELGVLRKCGGIELNKIEGSRTLSQLTWDHGGLWVLDHQSGSRQDLLHICSKYAAWCSCGSPNKWNWGCLSLCSLQLGPLPPTWTALLALSGRGCA